MLMRFLQFALSSAFGCVTYATLPSDTPKFALSMFMGVAGLFAVMKAYAWIRYGKEAAASVTLEP